MLLLQRPDSRMSWNAARLCFSSRPLPPARDPARAAIVPLCEAKNKRARFRRSLDSRGRPGRARELDARSQRVSQE